MDNHHPDNSHRKLGKWMTVGAWILGIALLTLLFDDKLEQQHNPNQVVETSANSKGGKEIVLRRNRTGHYVATGEINGIAVEFLVDTGASDVAVPARLADRLGLRRGAPVLYQTANGAVQGFRTRIQEVKLGDIVMENIDGGINPGMHSNQVLLGMSFLKYLEFSQRGNTLYLRNL